jgi:flagellin
MGFRIHTNLSSLRLRRDLEERNGSLQNNFRRLATGRRIGRAGDDAAGLAISQRMRSDLRSLGQTVRNAQSGIDFADGAESRLGEVSDNLVRLRELAVQASDGTLSSDDRAALDEEFRGLVAEIDRIAKDDSEGSPALDGSESIEVQAGTGADDTLSSPAVDATVAGLGLEAHDLSDAASAAEALDAVTAATDTVAAARSELGSFSRELSGRQSNAVRIRDTLTESESRISSLDVALESAALIQNRLLAEGGLAALLHAGTEPQHALRLLS